MKKLNQKLATENTIFTQAHKDPYSQQTKADYQLIQLKNSIKKRKKTTIYDEKIEPEISKRKCNNHTSR